MKERALENLRLYYAVLATAIKAASRDRALNAEDTYAICNGKPEPKVLGSLLLKMRKRDTLRPSDLTEIRIAVKKFGCGKSDLGFDFEKSISETWLENEQKKDTPRKRG